jgi:glycosyltransferase involved in cell wall biosynthesis
MRTKPAISVITPTYNRSVSLRRAILSVQGQTLSDYEHIIVDDSSQDDTESIVRSLSDTRIRYFRFDEWRGANPARNAGIEKARAGLLTFLDSDDEFLPHRLETIVEMCKGLSAPELLISSFQTMKRDQARPAVNPNLYLTGPHLEQALMMYGIMIAGSGITVRRETLVRAGGFAPTIRRLQDREVLLRLSKHCGAQMLSEVDWIKYPSPDSISGPRSGYVESLGAMFGIHADLAEKYQSLICYHVARHALTDLLRGRLLQVLFSLRANYQSPALGFSIARLVDGYRSGSQERRAFIAELKQRASESPMILPFRPREEAQPLEMAPLQRAA